MNFPERISKWGSALIRRLTPHTSLNILRLYLVFTIVYMIRFTYWIWSLRWNRTNSLWLDDDALLWLEILFQEDVIRGLQRTTKSMTSDKKLCHELYRYMGKDVQ